MRKILLIGIGCGNPEHLTLEAVAALNRADLFFIPDKGAEKEALRSLRMRICEEHARGPYRMVEVAIPRRREPQADYRATVDEWHAALVARYRALFESELAEGQTGAMLIWGDPALYDSAIRIVEAVREGGLPLDFEVIPGISSVQVLAARHRIPLNRIGGPILVTTGRRLAAGWPEGADSVVVMLDGEASFSHFPQDEYAIWWGAYLGTPDEILVSGPLAEVGERIRALRAQARAHHGWIMDTYLLRRLSSDEPDPA